MLQKSAIIRQLLRTGPCVSCLMRVHSWISAGILTAPLRFALHYPYTPSYTVRRILEPAAGADDANNSTSNDGADTDTSISSVASTASLRMAGRAREGGEENEGAAMQASQVKTEALVLEALAALDALSRKLGGALRLHAQPAFKPLQASSAAATQAQQGAVSYPAAGNHAAAGGGASRASLEGSAGGIEEEALALSLSLEGFAFLAIDSLVALLHHPAALATRPASASAAAAARAIPTRALAVIHALLPYLAPPVPTPAHGQRLLALLSSLAPAVAAPPEGALGDALPLLALRVLDLFPNDELPSLAPEIPRPIAALAVAAAAHWPSRFGPLVRALRPDTEGGAHVLAGIATARRLVARAQPVLSLLLAATGDGAAALRGEGPDRSVARGRLDRPLIRVVFLGLARVLRLILTSQFHPHSLDQTAAAASPPAWLGAVLQERVEPALPLLALAPDGDLVLLSLHLAARALALSSQPDDLAAADAAFAVGLRVVLALLALPCDDNRLAAHRELARFLQHGTPASGPSGPSSLLAALATSLPTKADVLTGPLPPRALARAVLGREEGMALLRHLLVFGVRDPVNGIRGAAWDAVGGALGVSGGEGEDEGEEKDGVSEEESMVVRRLPSLVPLLVAARGQADAEEGRGAMTLEAATVPLGTPGPRGLLARFVLQMAKAAAAQASGSGQAGEEESEDWALLAPLLDLFSFTPTLRLGARRQLYAMLQQEQQQQQQQHGAAQWPKTCTLRPEAAFAQDEEADEEAGRSGGWAARRSATAAAWAGGPRYGAAGDAAAAAAAEEAAASPARLGALCDLLLDPGALGETEQLAAARDLTLLLTMSMGRPAPGEAEAEGQASTSPLLPSWATARVLGAARQLLDGTTLGLGEAGAELLLAIAWSGSPLRPHALRPFAPFLFHSSPSIRGTIRLALLPALFGRRNFWTPSAVAREEQGGECGGPPMLVSDRAPEEVLARVPSLSAEEALHGRGDSSNCHSLTYLIHGPLVRGGGGSAAFMLPAFLARCFRLFFSPVVSSGAGLPRPLVWVHLLPPVDPSRDAIVSPAVLPALLDALIPLWYSQSLPDAASEGHGAASPLLSSVPALALAPHGPRARAAALAKALHDASSHSALSVALQAVTQTVLAAPDVADAFLELEWTKAMGRLLQARAYQGLGV
jgi:hypothetical protein